MKVLLFRGKGFVSWLIRVQTRSQYSHAAILVDDKWLYEAWQFEGVRKKEFDWKKTEGIDFYEINGLTPERKAKMLEYLESRLGNEYDYKGVIRFVTRRKSKSDDADFCSEYIFDASEAAEKGWWLARTEGWEVSPGLIGRVTALMLTDIRNQGTIARMQRNGATYESQV